MTYLRKAGIPFIAFRRAIAGSATGAHIHIGIGSLRAIETVSDPVAGLIDILVEPSPRHLPITNNGVGRDPRS
jgi:hypothetical protein